MRCYRGPWRFARWSLQWYCLSGSRQDLRSGGRLEHRTTWDRDREPVDKPFRPRRTVFEPASDYPAERNRRGFAARPRWPALRLLQLERTVCEQYWKWRAAHIHPGRLVAGWRPG